MTMENLYDLYQCAKCASVVTDRLIHSRYHNEYEDFCNCGWGGVHDPDNPKCWANTMLINNFEYDYKRLW